MIASGSLTGRLSRYVIAGVALIWLLALATTALVLQSEQAEHLDQTLLETARVFLPALERDFRRRVEDGGEPPFRIEGATRAELSLDEAEVGAALLYRLLDRDGRVLMQSSQPPGAAFPPNPPRPGYQVSPTHVFYTTAASADGFIAQVGDLRQERSQALRDSFVALLLPMLAILPLAYLLVGWISRAALQPLEALRSEIANRGDGRLDPIATTGQPDELAAITTTLNGFMTRLAQSLDGERAFATNAAHELRTPVAVALAQVQRMKAETTDPKAASHIDRVEGALKRMSRLVARLLQLARAEAGIGLSGVTQNAATLLELVLQDHTREQAKASRLVVSLPQGPVLTRIDPDAFAIVVNNLIENAVQHGRAEAPVRVVLTEDGVLSVCNEAPAMPVDDPAELKLRFRKQALNRDGSGLGLYICDTILRQVGGDLTLQSGPYGRGILFEARIRLPQDRP